MEQKGHLASSALVWWNFWIANIHGEPSVIPAQNDLLRAPVVKYKMKAMSAYFQAAHSAEMSE